MIEFYTGISTDYFVLGIGGFCLVLLILLIVIMVKFSSLKKKYLVFLSGKNAMDLEETLINRLEEVDELIASNNKNERSIEAINNKMLLSLDKFGLVKYDALDDQGGKLSFALAILDEKDNGFILNSMHGREGSYIYIKDVISSNTISNLSDEEREALDKAINYQDR